MYDLHIFKYIWDKVLLRSFFNSCKTVLYMDVYMDLDMDLYMDLDLDMDMDLDLDLDLEQLFLDYIPVAYNPY